MKKLKGDSVVVLEYHLRSDAFQNADGVGRANYYGVTGTPTAKIDGKRTIVGGSGSTFDSYLGAYNQEMLVPGLNVSPCTLRVDVLYDSTSRFLKVKTWVTALDTFTHADAHLRYAITESHLYYHWDSQDSLQDIVRKMLPDYNGVAFSIGSGQVFADSQSYVLDAGWVDKKCRVAVFVQSDYYLGKPVFTCAFSGLYPAYVFGDCTGDAVVDVGDVVFLVNYLYKVGTAPNPYGRGDCNRDCLIDVGDVIYLINYLYKSGPAPLKGCD
jgi:hypothetical protein